MLATRIFPETTGSKGVNFAPIY